MAAVDRELAAIREHTHRSGAAPAERSSDGRHHRIGVDDWSFLSTPRPRYRRPTKKLGLAAGAAALLLVVIVSGWVMLNDGPAPPAPPPTPVSHRNASAEAKLIALVRRQYGDQACKPVEPSGMATAEIHCERTLVAEGPESASYRIFGDPSAMTIAFDAIIRAGKPVICPGNIMSPGPWHKEGAPQTAAGTLLCTQLNNIPTVAWTTTADRLVSEIRDRRGFDQLNTWWTVHA